MGHVMTLELPCTVRHAGMCVCIVYRLDLYAGIRSSATDIFARIVVDCERYTVWPA
jgi:hypothetical protein